jgi:hypothetical protein
MPRDFLSDSDQQLPALVWSDRDVIYILSHLPKDSIVNGRDWAKQEARIAEIRELKGDWDEEGATAPDRALLDSAYALLRKQRMSEKWPGPSRIVPSPDGAIIIEWQTPTAIATLEIARPFEGDWMIQRPGYPAEFRTDEWRWLLSGYLHGVAYIPLVEQY